MDKKTKQRLWLKHVRESRGMTQNQMASYLNIPKTTYSSYEQGYRDPEIANAKTMAEKLKIKWPIFFESEVRESDYKNAMNEEVTK
ncbi:helix-turn-helix transcriptional regulator [Agrilactobacillus fermenti]|uniref:helix-turn-helix transcriptional regulator n=1 Tax=Agrilactobacillus fermenti TaxID=2586909 RepID=UPI001E644DD5|nr:helix-turn-helix transcriptional regulator [Agrilactobacillus fermenti]MCD2257103.1 helix-turn-helix transcriptional regulator [Agrilactobacillus fermenti]